MVFFKGGQNEDAGTFEIFFDFATHCLRFKTSRIDKGNFVFFQTEITGYKGQAF
jgi:hypothetical protein